MSTTSTTVFGAAAQTGSYETWNNLNNILSTSASEADVLLTADGFEYLSKTVVLTGSAAGTSVPASATITNIKVRVNCYTDDNTTTPTIQDMNIAGGNNKSASIAQEVAGFETFDGDLTYWGITQEEAHDFAEGTADLGFYVRIDSGSTTARVVYVDVQFTYTPEVVPCPVMF